jgi:predicted dinucleotide-binding enzyme
MLEDVPFWSHIDVAKAGGRRVIFLSSDDEGAIATVTALVEQLGYALVSLGKIDDGGQLVQAQDKSWGPLIFQDLQKGQMNYVRPCNLAGAV